MWAKATLLLGLLAASAVDAAGLRSRYDEASGRILLFSNSGGQEVELGYIEAGSSGPSPAPRYESGNDEESFLFDNSKVVIRREDRSGSCLTIKHWKNSSSEPVVMCQNHLSSHIYGGVESTYRDWPIEKNVYKHYAYVTNKIHHATIAARYWLFSDGRLVRVHSNVPLFVDQHTNLTKDKLCFSAWNKSPYPEDRPDNLMEYEMCSFADARRAHLYAVQNYLGKPTAIPEESVALHPTWQVVPPEANVRDRAADVVDHGFDSGVIEIHDRWETCSGSLTVDTTRFPDMRALTDDLHALGFRVTLWMHPFVNRDCEPFYSEALDKGYFVLNKSGTFITRWWRGFAGVVDFTNPEAAAWWTDRVSALRNETGVDGFMFDFGESSYLPEQPNIQPRDSSPVAFTDAYARAASQFGPMATLRTSVESQRLPNFFFMDPVDSSWGKQSGLQTLVPKLLEMSMLGHPFVMPENVGGDENHGSYPSSDMYIRWMQATVFMPAMRYHVKPWDYDNETLEICLKLIDLRAQYAPRIVELMKKTVEDGTPVNLPIWWLDPTDSTAQEISTEYLLGEDVLVAPVVQHGRTSRDIYLPEGYWRDESDPEHPTIRGPTWLYAYPAPLDTLPYFTRVSS
ncbi:myogenesis-regulating glycosidase-like [Schistocerca cancellata]|uniref:myogenesis-regulating glycosidase-like n=1 Tax=Schistocerca cancellata TaxID=274614 RepID=UPI002119A164|nr:myogenesis-regulating glycosidase-like [Schistocerca cancellata]